MLGGGVHGTTGAHVAPGDAVQGAIGAHVAPGDAVQGATGAHVAPGDAVQGATGAQVCFTVGGGVHSLSGAGVAPAVCLARALVSFEKEGSVTPTWRQTSISVTVAALSRTMSYTHTNELVRETEIQHT